MGIIDRLGAIRTDSTVWICPACDGTGISLVPSYDEDRNEKEPCSYCDGKGCIIMQEIEINTEATGESDNNGRK